MKFSRPEHWSGYLFPSPKIFPTQGSNPGFFHCRWIFYQLSHKGSPRILEWVAYPFSSGSSWPRNQTGVSCTAGRIFTSWATRESPNILDTCAIFHRCFANIFCQTVAFLSILLTVFLWQVIYIKKYIFGFCSLFLAQSSQNPWNVLCNKSHPLILYLVFWPQLLKAWNPFRATEVKWVFCYPHQRSFNHNKVYVNEVTSRIPLIWRPYPLISRGLELSVTCFIFRMWKGTG